MSWHFAKTGAKLYIITELCKSLPFVNKHLLKNSPIISTNNEAPCLKSNFSTLQPEKQWQKLASIKICLYICRGNQKKE